MDNYRYTVRRGSMLVLKTNDYEKAWDIAKAKTARILDHQELRCIIPLEHGIIIRPCTILKQYPVMSR